jgi:anhydro-N-acetylmuramic acid kinase
MSALEFHVIGLMSGTSLDGLDMAYCRFTKKKGKWGFDVKHAATIAYNLTWKSRLASAHELSSEPLLNLHTKYGRWIGQTVKKFISKEKINKLDLIASHGHTIFHQPHNGFTFQLGDGNAICAETGVTVVYDFRSLDVQLGGQGAPLVPVGDRHLFSDYDVCLNLGGIANLSTEVNNKRIAFDICFANMGLNYLASLAGLDYDRDGEMARKGTVNRILLNQINGFYTTLKARPSLAREQFDSKLRPLLSNKKIKLEDRTRTFCESIALEISKAINKKKRVSILATGGGARNKFLMELFRSKLDEGSSIIIPNSVTLDFKEAVVFAFLGLLKLQGETNVLRSVTKASRDSCSGVVTG